MPKTSVGVALLLGYALLSATARADDAARKPPPEDPDASFLEFLGSVDGLVEANPDYLAQAKAARVATTPVGAPAKAAAPPPPPPSAPGVKNNE